MGSLVVRILGAVGAAALSVTMFGSGIASADLVGLSFDEASSYIADRSRDYVFNLNCNNPLASPGNPGNSVMSPEGVKAKKDQATATRINKNPAWCEADDKNMEYCQAICKRTGLCEI
jgi:hypothetical protein